MSLFNEAKTTQVAARLLKLRGGKMSYLKLMKLLYLLDREALNRWGRPITFDKYFSMDQGQVLSKTLDLINGEVPPDQEGQSYWIQHISAPLGNREVELKQETPVEELSKAELELIDEVFKKYGKLSRWQLVDLHHELPEYHDPGGSCIRTEYSDILRVLGKTEAQIATVLQELKYLESVQPILGK